MSFNELFSCFYEYLSFFGSFLPKTRRRRVLSRVELEQTISVDERGLGEIGEKSDIYLIRFAQVESCLETRGEALLVVEELADLDEDRLAFD